MSSFSVDFTKVTDVFTTPFQNFWGNNSQLSMTPQGMLFGSGPNNDYAAMGIMQHPSGVSAGEGYGVFSFTARHVRAAQPGGCYLLLWRADNQWIVSTQPGLITEMDMWETFDNSAHVAATTHYWAQGWPGSDGYNVHNIACDPTKLHVATYVWSPGLLEYFFDNVMIFSVSGATVPKDFADGGCNQCMGVGAETETSPVGMYVTEASYTSAADVATAGGAAKVIAAQVARAGGAAVVAPPVTKPPPVTPPVTVPPVAAAPLTGTFKITGAVQTGTKLFLSFNQNLSASVSLYLSGQVAGGAMVGIGEYWDSCPPGTHTEQPYWTAAPANLSVIELAVPGTGFSDTFTLVPVVAAPPAPYTFAQLEADLIALMPGSLAQIEALCAKYLAGLKS